MSGLLRWTPDSVDRRVIRTPATAEQAPEGEGQPEGVRVTRVGRAVAADLVHPAQPVADGVGVHEQRARRGLHGEALVEEDDQGLQQAAAGVLQRVVELAGQRATGVPVAVPVAGITLAGVS